MDIKKLEAAIATCLDTFHRNRLEKIKKIKLNAILARKNPYLFRALATEQGAEIVKEVLFAFLSSSDETRFGNDFFEPIAAIVSGGKPAEAKGVDITVEHKDRFVAYAIKSGPNALNASALAKQQLEFDELRNRLFKLHKQFDPVLAASYGRRNLDPKGKRTYRVLSGQKFWAEITGDQNFYLTLIRLMRDIPMKHMEAYKPEWDATVNRLTGEFLQDFCIAGRVDWDKLVRFVSAEKQPANAKKKKK